MSKGVTLYGTNDSMVRATGQQLEPEQAAALAELQAEAAGEAPIPGTQEAAAAEAAANAPPPPDIAAELSGLLLTVAAVLKPALPSLATIYTDESCQAAGAAVAAVCNKHGWLQGGIVGGYGEEIAAAAVLGPLAVATYTGVRADLARTSQAPPGGTLTPPAADPTPPANVEPAAPEYTLARG